MAEKEHAYRWGLIGRNGTGKSSFLKNYFMPQLSNGNYEKVFIVSMTTPKAYTGITRIANIEDVARWQNGAVLYYNYQNSDQMLLDILEHCNNGNISDGAIVFDDCSNYLEHHPVRAIRNFINNHRMYGLDLFFTCHDYKDLSSFVRRRLNRVTVFKTEVMREERELKYLDYPSHTNLYIAQQRVCASTNDYENITIKTGV